MEPAEKAARAIGLLEFACSRVGEQVRAIDADADRETQECLADAARRSLEQAIQAFDALEAEWKASVEKRWDELHSPSLLDTVHTAG
jgi:hypothetical protein